LLKAQYLENYLS